MFRLEEVLDLAIRLEKNGASRYRHWLNLITEPQIRATLSWLAEQETQHAEFFAHLKEINAACSQVQQPDAQADLHLEDFLGSRTLSLDEVEVLTLTNPGQALQIALEFERDTILFFDMIKVFITEESALTQLAAIIEEERRHIDLLESLIAERVAPAAMQLDSVVAQ
jgi:rubrerythrin